MQEGPACPNPEVLAVGSDQIHMKKLTHFSTDTSSTFKNLRMAMDYYVVDVRTCDCLV